MEDQAVKEREEYAEDLSGAEYLSLNDREKKAGYNGVPHRPTRPARDKPLHGCARAARRKMVFGQCSRHARRVAGAPGAFAETRLARGHMGS